MTARDLLRVVGVDDPQAHPDGHSVVWRRGVVDAERDAYRYELVVTSLDGASERVLVEAAAGIRAPRWTRDGRWLLYLAPHGAGSEVFAVAAEGGAPRRLTDLGGPIAELAPSPSGDAIALVLPRQVGPEPGGGFNADVLRVTRLRWKRDGTGLIGDRFDQLALVPLDPLAPAPVREPRWLVRGRVDVAGAVWSPDGRTLAFVSALDDPDWERSRRSAVYLLDVSVASAAPRRLASFADVRAQALAWSPDGRALALTGHDHDGIGHYGAQRLWTLDARSGARRALTSDAVGTFGNAAYTDTGGSGASGPVWAPAGDALVAVLSAGSTVRLVRVGLDGGVVALTPPDRVVAGFAAVPDGERWVVVSRPRERSADLELVEARAGADPAPRRLTRAGDAVVEGVRVATARPLRVDDGRGPALDAWVLLPESEAPRSAPVVLYCGGGPGGMRSDNLHLEWQLFVAAGYAVVWANTRGCQGYGDPFCTAILGSWGEADVVDNLRALDAALAAYPQLDPERQAVAGGSYGGFQVAWMLGATDRFAAAVADRVVADKLAAFGMSDIGALRAFEFGGAAPWEDPAAYLRQSPIDRIGGARTPTLVVHSAQDHRCTVGQGEALYASLRAQGVETRLVRFPNESHGLSRGGRPWHRVRRLQEYLDWFDRHLGRSRRTGPESDGEAALS